MRSCAGRLAVDDQNLEVRKRMEAVHTSPPQSPHAQCRCGMIHPLVESQNRRQPYVCGPVDCRADESSGRTEDFYLGQTSLQTLQV